MSSFKLIVKIHAVSILTRDSSLVYEMAQCLPRKESVKKKEGVQDAIRVWGWWKSTDRRWVGEVHQNNVDRLICEIDEGIDSLRMEYKC